MRGSRRGEGKKRREKKIRRKRAMEGRKEKTKEYYSRMEIEVKILTLKIHAVYAVKSHREDGINFSAASNPILPFHSLVQPIYRYLLAMS